MTPSEYQELAEFIVAQFGKQRAEFVARFDQSAQRFEQIDRRFEQIDRRFEQIDQRFEQIDQRFEQIDQRFEQIDRRFEQIDRRFEQIDRRFEQVDQRFEQIDRRLEALEARTARAEVVGEDTRTRLSLVVERIDFLDARVERLRDEMHEEFASVRQEMRDGIGFWSRRIEALEQRPGGGEPG